MILKKLISRQGWLNIEAALLHLYPAQQKYLASYEAVYYKLLLLPEAETDLQIEIKEMLPLSGNTSNYIDVCGKKWPPHVADADISLCYALDFTPWAQWLAMPVTAKTLQAFSETEIVAHCLQTMTGFSFDEADIYAECERLTMALSAFNN